MSVTRAADQYPKWMLGLTALVMAGVVGAIDYITGTELSLSVLYLLPISLTAWSCGDRTTLLLSILCALIGLFGDVYTGHPYSHDFIPYWNAVMRCGTFFVVGACITRLKTELEREQRLTREDYLTGAANSRSLYEFVEAEIYRAERHGQPLTVAVIDCDNFKHVNDTFGHRTGDELLRSIVPIMRSRLRKTDLVARIGGDEFTLIMPEITGSVAQNVIERIRSSLLEEMQSRGWPVTFSIGCVTFLKPPASVEEMLNEADQVMYTVKHSTKDDARCAVADGTGPTVAARCAAAAGAGAAH